MTWLSTAFEPELVNHNAPRIDAREQKIGRIRVSDVLGFELVRIEILVTLDTVLDRGAVRAIKAH